MDKIRSEILKLFDGCAQEQEFQALFELIEEYAEDQWSRGHEVGKEDGFKSGFDESYG
jgi:hypothetical protein